MSQLKAMQNENKRLNDILKSLLEEYPDYKVKIFESDYEAKDIADTRTMREIYISRERKTIIIYIYT